MGGKGGVERGPLNRITGTAKFKAQEEYSQGASSGLSFTLIPAHALGIFQDSPGLGRVWEVCAGDSGIGCPVWAAHWFRSLMETEPASLSQTRSPHLREAGRMGPPFASKYPRRK